MKEYMSSAFFFFFKVLLLLESNVKTACFSLNSTGDKPAVRDERQKGQ